MKIGDERKTTEICQERGCDECGEAATREINFLLEGVRGNPKSSAYGKDDCSWCSDKKAFSCEAHQDEVTKANCEGYVLAGTFERGERFEHLFLYWGKVRTTAYSDVPVEAGTLMTVGRKYRRTDGNFSFGCPCGVYIGQTKEGWNQFVWDGKHLNANGGEYAEIVGTEE